MKKHVFWGYYLFPLFILLGFQLFSQGADTQAGAASAPITLPFSSAGSTVGATNNYDMVGTTVDDGPDWYYYYCSPSNATIWVTITFTPSTASPVGPSITVLNSTGATLLGQTQIAGDYSGTYGIPYTPAAGQCYYFVVDNDGALGNGFNYNIQISNTVPAHPANPTQPACTNIGFDAGGTTGWLGSWGHSMQTGVAPQPTPTYTPLFYNTTGGHHTITTPGTDLMAPIQTVCPQIPGNTNSLMLGDGPNWAYGGASIEQKFQVTASNALFIYYYALVIQDGGAAGSTAHTDQEQPYFKIDALDCVGNPIACGNLLVTGGPGIPGFTQIGSSGNYYKDWTPVMLDLTPYIGSCVTMRFTVGDCSIGAHFAYAYLDAVCAPMSIVAPPTICQFQTSLLTAPAGAATYSWVETSAPGTVIGTSNTLSVTPTATGTFNYQCTMTSLTGCNSVLSTSVTVLPSPQITVTNPAPVCSPATVNLTAAGVVTINSGSGTIGYFSDAACTVPIASPAAVAVSGTYYIRILNANGCYEIEPVIVVVNASPAANVTTADQSICIGSSVNLNATLTPAGFNNPVTFTNTNDFPITDASTTPTVSPITVTGITQQTPGVLPIVSVNLNIPHTYVSDVTVWLQCPNGNIIELTSDNGGAGQNYTNTTFVPTGAPSITTGTAPFTGNFTPEEAFSLLNSCAVNGTWNLMVYDLGFGDVGTLTDWSITFNNYVAPTFVWSPTTNMTNSTTLNPTVAPTATTTYALTATNSIGGCTSTDQVTITVNPLPTATIAGTAAVCQNATAPTITFTGANGTAPYTFTYNINGGTNQTVSSGAGITATVTAPTTATGTFTYNLVSVTSAAGCSQNQTGSAIITVNPIPTVNTVASQTVCANTSTTAVTFTGNNTASTTFNWVNNTPSIGLGATGSGNIGAFTALNTTGAPVTATITVTPTLNGCTGSPQNFTMTVNPIPTVNAVASQTVCANTSTTAVTFTGNNTASTTFNWVNNTPSIGLGATGSGNIGAFTALNTTGAPVTATITVTPTLNGCTGSPQNFTMTVNPIPTVNAVASQTVCANASTTAITFTGNNTASTTFNWVNNTPSIGLGANGSGNIGAFTALNATGSSITATITVTPVLNSCNGSPQNFTIVVSPSPTISGVFTACAGLTTQLTGSGTPATANPWVSSNPAVATINATGLVNGISAGSSTITYTNSAGCSITQAVTITSGATISGTATICAGATTQLTGSGIPATANPWTSSNTAVATVSNTGLVTGVSGGTVTITYTNSSGCLDNEVVTVNGLPTITGSDVCIGATTQLNGSGTANATNPWVSSNPAVATINATGLVNGISAGTVTITYTNSNGCSNTMTLNVLGTPTISGTLNACVGATTQLSATGIPAATNPWTSSNPAVATVSNTGLVTGISAGTATITFTNSGSCQNTALVTINPLPSITGSLNVCVGLTTQLTGSPTAAASNAWTSSNNAVATVSGTGLVTGVSAGTAVISYTNNNGCSQTATITVNALPTATISGTSSICAGSSATFTISGTPNASVVYSNGTTNSSVTLNAAGTATVTTGVLNTSTTYSLVSAQSAAPASCGNLLSGSITITVNSNPAMDPVTNVVVCPGDNVAIPSFTSTPAGATYSWTNTNTSIGLGASGTGDLPVFTAVNPGAAPISGSVTVIPTIAGCSGTSVTFTIGVSSNPLANAGTDLNLCINATTGNQIGSAPVAGNTYSWSPVTGLSDPAIANPTVSAAVDGATSYTLTVTNGAGCEATDVVSVIVHPLPTVNFNSSATDGCAPVSITFTNTSQVNSVNCVWTFEGGNTVNTCGSVTEQFETAGVYGVTLTITDGNGCTNSLTKADMITVYPEVDASFDVNVYQQSVLYPVFQFTNTSTNATEYTWEFGDGTTSSQVNPTHTYDETPGVYHIILYASNPAGCNDSAVAVVSVIDELIFYVPNAFTPDGDEFNNAFLPVFSSGFDAHNYTLLIFNRWGEILFESHDVHIGWDGTYMGQLCKEGVYTWKINFKERNKDKHSEHVGHVNLLK
ncbi:Leupeptin-inactivating enzyme 1 precursor [compost metagenome]